MIKRTKFGKASKARLRTLRDRINYISDVTHPHHAGKTVYAARNYRCEDNTPEAFEFKAVECFKRYDKNREGKKGNRTKKLFEEHIYSSADDAFLTDSERRLIEKALIENAFNFVPVRTAWHVGQGRSDLHILSAGYTDDIPPSVHLSTDFGHGKRDFLLTLERAERDALDEINRQRHPSRKIFSAREAKRRNMKKVKAKTLAERLAAIWDGRIETIEKVLQKLGFEVTKLTKKSVSVISPGKSKSKPRRYNLETLRENIEGIDQPTPARRKRPKQPEINLPPL
jgi:hypothetical protein